MRFIETQALELGFCLCIHKEELNTITWKSCVAQSIKIIFLSKS